MSGRSAAIDNLRGAAVLVVVLGHWWGFGGLFGGAAWAHRALVLSPFGVDLFFGISGYLLGGQLLDCEPSVGLLGRFYLRRLARTLPLYLVVVALCWPAIGAGERVALLTFTQNFYWLGHGSGMEIAGPTWSLAVEEQFYLVLPGLIFAVPRARLPWVLVGLGVASEVARSWMLGHGQEVAAFTSLPARMDALVLGVALAWRAREWPVAPTRLPEWRWLAWVGRRSYSVYLLHLPVGLAVGSVAGQDLACAGFALGAVLAASDLAYRAVERPVHEWARAAWPLRAGPRLARLAAA